MAASWQTRLGRLVAVGTGVGIEIDGPDLRLTVARVRPGGATVLGVAHLPQFRERPAAEWGAEYAGFLRRTGGGHLSASVLLPRADVIVRTLVLPGVGEKDLAGAVRFQIDSLHPYGEEDVAYDFQRVGRTPTVLVVIARQSLIDDLAARFAEAGIKVASFTVSAGVLRHAVRLLDDPPAEFLAVSEKDGALEVYGESVARPLFSAILPPAALGRAAAELRLPPDAAAVSLDELLPRPRQAPENAAATAGPLPYATALADATPWLAPVVNLLPAGLRRSSARAIYVPTAVLGVLLLGLFGALLAQSAWEDRRYLQLLQTETAKFEPRARQLAQVERNIATSRARAQRLDAVRARTRHDMDALSELTKILPAPAWVNGLELTRKEVVVSGEAEQAAPLLKALDSSPLFQGSEFTTGIVKQGPNEAFRIRVVRERGSE